MSVVGRCSLVLLVVVEVVVSSSSVVVVVLVGSGTSTSYFEVVNKYVRRS